MKIHQMLPNYWYGDAIGNCVAEIDRLLKDLGHETEIFADVVHHKLSARNYKDYAAEADGSWLIYHYSTGSPVNRFALENAHNVILMYHNITPGEYFDRYNPEAARGCREARETLAQFAGKVKFAMAGSAYNEEELKSLGFEKTAITPYILNFDKIKPSGKNPFNDGKTNILFVGRVAPNKRHEDMIAAYHYYRDFINQDSRLVFVGGYDQDGLYYKSLQNLIEIMNLGDVVFTGPVPDEILGDYYQSASVFLCLSRHEGFCIPLLEAMKFRIPVVALGATGVNYTMGDAGIKLKEIRPNEIAEIIGLLDKDAAMREKVIQTQFGRLGYFARDKMAANFKRVLSIALNGG
ncbi:MAG: glycosyltransferase family 4 protein [Nitrospinae bacterium]|nr:glycosyltransferase family 4 protein [Nitrospinota bacterium]